MVSGMDKHKSNGSTVGVTERDFKCVAGCGGVG